MSNTVPLYGFGGGGGTALNFSVVGNPQPANPKENTILVDTDEPITGWGFSTTNPFVESVEIYTSVGAQSGVYIDQDGSIVSSANMKLTTDKIPLPEKTVSVTITASSTVTTAVSHAFYDSNGNLISTVKRQAGTATYNVPVNAKSVRIGIYNGDTESLLANLSCAENGTVWFYTGTSRGVEFNALKKNGITVYPLNAKQYINGSWVAKSAKIYQNGSWVDWITWYYKSGEGSKVGTWTKKLQSSATTNNIQFNNDGIYFVHAQTAHAVLYAFSPLVDLTDIDTLYFKYNYAVGGSSGVAGVSLETFDGSVTSKFVASINLPEATSDTIVSLDVSGLSGKHYIGIRSYAATGKLGTNYCYDVWGE